MPQELIEVATDEFQCRYCLGSGGVEDVDTGELIAPCSCTGGQRWVHKACLVRWQRSVLAAQPTHPALYGDEERITHCGVCKGRFANQTPSRHEMMVAFAGADMAALIRERSLICASERFSVGLRTRLHASPQRRSIHGFVHWCQGVYLIIYVGPKQLSLSIPDDQNRYAVMSKIDPQGRLVIQGKCYRFLPEPPLQLELHLASASSSVAPPTSPPAADLAVSLVTGESIALNRITFSDDRGAEWVRSALHGRRRQTRAGDENEEVGLETIVARASTMDSSPQCDMRSDETSMVDTSDVIRADVADATRLALASLLLPAEVQLEAIDDEVVDSGNDTIRAVNLGNTIADKDLGQDALTEMRRAWRSVCAASDRAAARRLVNVRHHLGGPCAQGRCTVILPLSSGSSPPLPQGFRVLDGLDVAVGNNLGEALRTLLSARRNLERSGTHSEKRSASVMESEGFARCASKTSTRAKRRRLAASSVSGTSSSSEETLSLEEDQEEEYHHEDGFGIAMGEFVGGGSLPSTSMSSRSRAFSSSDPNTRVRGWGLLEESTDSDDEDVNMIASVAADSLCAVGSQSFSPNAPPQRSVAPQLPPLLVFWGEAKWNRTQLLGELARGDWGLCEAMPGDLNGSDHSSRGLWRRVVVESGRLMHAPESEMTREMFTDTAARPVAPPRLEPTPRTPTESPPPLPPLQDADA